MSDYIVRAGAYHLECTDAEEAGVIALFEARGIAHHRGSPIAIALDGDAVVGALTEDMGGEWSVAVDAGYQGIGIATELVRHVIDLGGAGFMVAGTDDGAEWLSGLQDKLTPEQRDSLDVPMWHTTD